jgi:hypothetical protein
MENSKRLIKYGIWAYFFLLIFEGALRKWFLPGLATPLLIVRDPLVLWIFYQCWKKNLLPSNIYLNSMLIVGSIAVLTAVFIGHGSLTVALYGARGFLIHFPMVFIIGKIMNHNDVIKVGKMVLLIAIPMAVLIAIQFYSPQSAWVNRGLGNDEAGAGFSGAMGYFRPPGTFSFTLGVATFFGLVASFVLYFWMNKKLIRSWLLILATIGLIMAIPLTISRGLLFQVIISCAFLFIAVIRKPEYIGKIIIGTVIIILAVSILAYLPFFNTATEAFSARLTNAGATEGGMKGTLVDRFLGEQISAFDNAMTQPYFGYGLGMGTNAGSKLLTGNVQYLIAEGEWPRVIGEMGLLIGVIVLLIRISLSVKLFFASLKKMQKGQLLPWMLLSFALILMINGNWAQPTALGFYALGAGLLMASLNESVQYIPVYVLQEDDEEEKEAEEQLLVS